RPPSPARGGRRGGVAGPGSAALPPGGRPRGGGRRARAGAGGRGVVVAGDAPRAAGRARRGGDDGRRLRRGPRRLAAGQRARVGAAAGVVPAGRGARRTGAGPGRRGPARAARVDELTGLLAADPGHRAAREALVENLLDAGEPDRARDVLAAWPGPEPDRDARYWRLRGRFDLDYDHRPGPAAAAFA